MLTAAPTFLSLPLAYILHEGREAGIFFTSFLVATAVLADSFLFATSFAYLLAISAMLFLGIASFRVAQQGILRQAVAVADLREGDMLARGIAGVPAMARGVTMAEISRLKKAGLKAVEIRKSAPFIPALFAGLAASAALTNLFI
jgi:prepilin signal peptidase PulO-like enzyme (type II secretory pathway)